MDREQSADRRLWSLQVVVERIATVDGDGASCLRLILSAGLAATFPAAGLPLLALLLLVPGLAQGLLEIGSRRERETGSRWPLVRWVSRTTAAAARRLWLLNATGVLGTIAVAGQLAALAWLAPGGHPGWRLTALVLATLYLNSGTVSVLLDSPVFHPRRGPVVAWVYRLRLLFGPALAGVLEFVFLLLSPDWPDHSRPAVALACLLPLAITAHVHTHDALIEAAYPPTRRRAQDARLDFYDHLHGQLSDRLHRAERLARRNRDTPPELAETVRQLPTLLRAIRDLALDPDQVHLDVDVPTYASALATRLAGATIQVTGEPTSRWSPADVNLGMIVVANLMTNAYEAGSARRSAGVTDLRVHVATSAGSAVVTVHDRVALIPDDVWTASGTSLARLRAQLARRAGTLAQEAAPDGKVITARWRLDAEG